jgi:hypothetical protein
MKTEFIDDIKALPEWRYVFVCTSKRCVEERLAEIRQLEQKFPYYKYNYKCEQIGDKYVIRLINVTQKKTYL